MESLNGHEAGNGGYSQGDTYGNSPFLDPTFWAALSFKLQDVDAINLFKENTHGTDPFGSEIINS